MCYLSFLSRDKRVTDPALPQKLSTDPPRTGIPLGEHQSTSASTPALPHSLPVNKPTLRGIYLSSPCRVILPPRHNIYTKYIYKTLVLLNYSCSYTANWQSSKKKNTAQISALKVQSLNFIHLCNILL